MNHKNSQSPSERTRVRQSSKRASYETETLYAVLDACSIGHVAFIQDGAAHSIPTAIARIDDGLWLHGSRSSRLYKILAAEQPVSVSACVVDGLVKARSAFHCSMNYRSAVVYGCGTPVSGERKTDVLDQFTEKLIPASAGDYRPHMAKELKATELIRIPLDEASCKVRTGDPVDDAEDLELPYWAGVIPFSTIAGEPEPANDLVDGVAFPENMRRHYF